ncbi:MAG: hypothetical protein JW789_01840 [Candidatus Aenigmarchaeota archaeon]|nr:hypothetical protein [Candidatus Aenigmarchaeota archaeon]
MKMLRVGGVTGLDIHGVDIIKGDDGNTTLSTSTRSGGCIRAYSERPSAICTIPFLSSSGHPRRKGDKLNAAYNCLDRHIDGDKGDRT